MRNGIRLELFFLCLLFAALLDFCNSSWDPITTQTLSTVISVAVSPDVEGLNAAFVGSDSVNSGIFVAHGISETGYREFQYISSTNSAWKSISYSLTYITKLAVAGHETYIMHSEDRYHLCWLSFCDFDLFMHKIHLSSYICFP